MKTKVFTALACLTLVLFPLTALKAANTQTGNSIYVPGEEIVNGNFYAVGQDVTIDGTVSGDVIAVAQTITINGRVEGDIITVSQDVVINGSVGGNVRIAGNSLTINGAVARNVNTIGNKIIFGPDSRVGWDVYLIGANAELRGTVDGGLSGQAGQTLITGKVGENVNLKLAAADESQKLTVASGAIINGDVTYTSNNAASISDKASIAGKVQQKVIETKQTNTLMLWLWRKLFSIFCALAVGLVLIFAGKNISLKILNKMADSPAKMILPGLMVMLILPPIALILIFTLIGIPLALIISAWWITATYIAKIYTAIYAGQFMLQKITKKSEPSLLWSLVIGIVICWLLFAIPIFGWIIALVAAWIGLGGIWFYTSNQLGNI